MTVLSNMQDTVSHLVSCSFGFVAIIGVIGIVSRFRSLFYQMPSYLYNLTFQDPIDHYGLYSIRCFCYQQEPM